MALEADVTIGTKLGLHARPASLFVKEASGFDCDVFISKGGIEANGKSIMGVLMLAAESGSTVHLRCDGSDEAEALERLTALLESELDKA
jgi:phosphotransferase system HPr (HPr) family protein